MEARDGALALPWPHRPDVMATLANAALPSVRLASGGSGAVTGSRLGGSALVEADFVWPHTQDGKLLSFVGQLNCDDVNTTLGEPVLPAKTVLAFFYEADEQLAWGFDPNDAQYWKVVATPIDRASIAPTPDGALTFATVALDARRVLTLPECYEPPIQEYWAADGPGVCQLYEHLDADGQTPLHRVFGWPDLNQSPMRLECQLASNGIWVGGPEGFEDPRVPDLRDGAGDWILLWQLDTDADAGWMWGDMGTMYFWIRRQDLATGAFDRAWMVLQG